MPALALALVASVSVTPLARAQPTDAAGAGEAEARSSFQAALARYDEGRFADALEGFERSAALVASPNFRLYVARCLRELGRLAEAVDAYDATITAADADEAARARYAATKRAADEERERLEPRIARLRLVGVDALPTGARVLVAGRAVPTARWSAALPVNPGRTTIEVQRPDGTADHREIALNAGGTATVAVAVPAAPAPEAGAVATVPAARAGYHTAAWIAGGVAIAGAASAVTFWALARRRWDDLRDRCAGPCPASEGGAIDRGRFYQTMTNASWIVAGVGAAGALGLAIAAHRADTTEVSVAVSPAGLIVAGAF